MGAGNVHGRERSSKRGEPDRRLRIKERRKCGEGFLSGRGTSRVHRQEMTGDVSMEVSVAVVLRQRHQLSASVREDRRWRRRSIVR